MLFELFENSLIYKLTTCHDAMRYELVAYCTICYFQKNLEIECGIFRRFLKRSNNTNLVWGRLGKTFSDGG